MCTSELLGRTVKTIVIISQRLATLVQEKIKRNNITESKIGSACTVGNSERWHFLLNSLHTGRIQILTASKKPAATNTVVLFGLQT